MDIQKMPASGHHELLTLEETAALLRVSKSWIYERTRKGTIPYLKLGKYLRFPLAELLVWIAAHGRSAGKISPDSLTGEGAGHIRSKRSAAMIQTKSARTLIREQQARR